MSDIAYKVTNQTQNQRLVPGQGLQDGVTVYWQSSDGHTGNVWVPAAQYSVDSVRTRICAAIETMRAVAASGE